MREQTLSRSAIMMALIVSAVVVLWEMNLRSNGITIAYDDGPPLWADKRAMVYEPSDKAVVFIGSSRIKFDLDIPTWESMTGTHAIQLAQEGNSPRPSLEDLANDPDFKGHLIVDVTEGLFFTDDESSIRKNVKYFHERTPAQRAGFELNRMLESGLVLLDKNNLSLNAQLEALEIPSREGVFMMPVFPLDFGLVSFERQKIMTDRFVADTNLQNRVKNIWYFFHKFDKEGPFMPDSALTVILQSVKSATDKIKMRGGEVMFVRMPSTNYPGENRFPREQYWDKLLAYTGCPGIHYADYAGMRDLVCPELSHLTPRDAVTFTKQFVGILAQEKGWAFPDFSH